MLRARTVDEAGKNADLGLLAARRLGARPAAASTDDVLEIARVASGALTMVTKVETHWRKLRASVIVVPSCTSTGCLLGQHRPQLVEALFQTLEALSVGRSDRGQGLGDGHVEGLGHARLESFELLEHEI